MDDNVQREGWEPLPEENGTEADVKRVRQILVDAYHSEGLPRDDWFARMARAIVTGKRREG